MILRACCIFEINKSKNVTSIQNWPQNELDKMFGSGTKSHFFQSYKAHTVTTIQENLLFGSRLIRVKFLTMENFYETDISSISHSSRALALRELL